MNRLRGERRIAIDGADHLLCLTLGALAEIETAFGLGDLSELEARLKAPRAEDIALVLAALLRGGGNPLSREEILAKDIDVFSAVAAIGEVFAAAGRGTGT